MTDPVSNPAIDRKSDKRQKPKAAKAAGTLGVDSFKLDSADGQEFVRVFAETGLRAARSGYEALRTATAGAQSTFEDAFETIRTGAIDFNRRLVDYAQAQSDAVFSFARKAVGITSFAEIVTLQSAFLREQFDSASVRSRELRELATKLAAEAAEPLREATSLSADWFKAAAA